MIAKKKNEASRIGWIVSFFSSWAEDNQHWAFNWLNPLVTSACRTFA